MPCGLFCFHHVSTMNECVRVEDCCLPRCLYDPTQADQLGNARHTMRGACDVEPSSYQLCCARCMFGAGPAHRGRLLVSHSRHGISTYRMEPAGPCHDTLSVPYRSITLRMRSDLFVNPLDIAAVVVLCRPSRSPLDAHLLKYQTIQHVLVIQLTWDPASRDTHTAQQLLPAHLPSC